MLKKIYLVPADLMDNAKAPPASLSDPTGFGYEIKGGVLAKLKALEADIDRVQRDANIPDDQKFALISQLQGNLQRFQGQFRSGISLSAPAAAVAAPSLPAVPSTLPAVPSSASSAFVTEEPASGVPPTKRRKKEKKLNGEDVARASPPVLRSRQDEKKVLWKNLPRSF